MKNQETIGFSTRLDPQIKKDLDELARTRDVPLRRLVEEALVVYLQMQRSLKKEEK